ncbi:hypothetical protein Mgra_00005991 [Meloidogyne graminicola]|uniref:Leprecan-like alpha-helical domain-containing protein n=1 Tax=Meloidogyne graminicola TaxID=189291 RepID=A0A8S9ZMS0_9BILA|nr:hypothetical protein Mgra_00005991 [Meloidogyne graminicola]
MEQKGFKREMLIDLWKKPYENFYLNALNSYDKKEWLNCVNLFKESLQKFWEALEDCKLECEYLNNYYYEEEEEEEWSAFIAKSYLLILQCQQNCFKQLSFLNGLKHGRDACQSVENSLLIKPKNIIMRRNKLFYLNIFNGGNILNDTINLFQPSEEIKHFLMREKLEQNFLNFMELNSSTSFISSSPLPFEFNLIDQFNYSKLLHNLISPKECLFLRSSADFFPEYFPHFRKLLISEFLNRISEIYELEELPSFEGIYCVSKGLFGKSNCGQHNPTISVSINEGNCGQIGGGEQFTGFN